MGLPLPSAVCKDAGAAAAMRAAISGIATCLPDATEVQTIANSVTVCSSFYTIFLSWIAVIWKALCYLATNTPDEHTGTPTLDLDAGALGTGATYELIAGSTDVHGGAVITVGAGPSAGGGNLGVLTFGTPFTAQIFPSITFGNIALTISYGFTPGFSSNPPDPGGVFTTPVTDIAIWGTLGNGSDFLQEGDQFTVIWNIGYVS